MSEDPRFAGDLAAIDYWLLHYVNIEGVAFGSTKRKFPENFRKYVTGSNRDAFPESAFAYDWMARQLGVA
jgi:hypothetical protein